MKKLLTTLVLLLVCVSMSYAVPLTAAQRKAKEDIFNALKKIAVNVSEYDDERISFTVNGTRFFVHVVPENNDPLYLVLSLGINLSDKYQLMIIPFAARTAAENMPVFFDNGEDYVIFDCEMYAQDAKPFIAVLPDMIRALQKAYDNFEEAYEYYEGATDSIISGLTSDDDDDDDDDSSSASLIDMILKGSGSESTTGSVSSTANANEFIYPYVANTGDDKELYLTKVTRTATSTILDITSYNGGLYESCYINKDSYIMVNGKKYTMTRTEGISTNRWETHYPNYESGRNVSLSFRLFFPAIPSDATTIDFAEGDYSGWRISGIQLDKGKKILVNSNIVETSVAKWRCTAVELRDKQTIVTKVCTPKTAGEAAHWCSQEEYIEDADTGRKYYLKIGTAGFESSPYISHDTSPITFYEVYPALPATVTRINIFSGKEYYIKNLQIR